jgi:hypothetical protein
MRTGHFEQAEAEFNAIVVAARKLFKADDARFHYLSFNISVCRAKRGVLTQAGRERLSNASSQKLDSTAVFAIVALARNDYINAQFSQFRLRIQALIPRLRPEQVNAELDLWIALANGEKSSESRPRALIQAIAPYDPVIARLFRAELSAGQN